MRDEGSHATAAISACLNAPEWTATSVDEQAAAVESAPIHPAQTSVGGVPTFSDALVMRDSAISACEKASEWNVIWSSSSCCESGSSQDAAFSGRKSVRWSDLCPVGCDNVSADTRPGKLLQWADRYVSRRGRRRVQWSDDGDDDRERTRTQRLKEWHRHCLGNKMRDCWPEMRRCLYGRALAMHV